MRQVKVSNGEAEAEGGKRAKVWVRAINGQNKRQVADKRRNAIADASSTNIAMAIRRVMLYTHTQTHA